jgi:hypothetical protein
LQLRKILLHFTFQVCTLEYLKLLIFFLRALTLKPTCGVYRQFLDQNFFKGLLHQVELNLFGELALS